MARTRSKPAGSSKKETTSDAEPPSHSTSKALPPSPSNPPKLFVLPKTASPETRIITLNNPATSHPSRYFFSPDHGFYEFTRIAAPRKTPRSCLLTPETNAQDGKPDMGDKQEGKEDKVELGTGYITKTADLFIATPIDILFLLLPALSPPPTSKTAKQHFLSLDDYLDTLTASSPHLQILLSQHPSLRERIQRRMAAVCDTVDAGDETMYRISYEKLLAVLLEKAGRMAEKLPASMEERFITPVLEMPVLSVKREDSGVGFSSVTVAEEEETSLEDGDAEAITKTTTVVEKEIVTETTTTDASVPTLITPPTIPPLLRLRTSLTYLLSSYIPAPLHPHLNNLLSSSPTPIFAPLTTHLAALAKLKSEAQALRSISDNISRKRGFEDDEEKIAEREEKKRKKEEEEKRKKGGSRAVKALQKADTSGMKKLSSFFAKKA